MKKKLPIGISDFKEIVERGEYYYVDKSLIIKDLLDHGAKSMLFTRPRRFGKTLNLSMLRYFFEKTDENTADLFTNLAISRQGSTYMNYQGKHPVIYLTFKDVKSRQWSKSLEHLKRVISEEYRRHKYLLTNADLDRYEEREFQEIIGLTATETAYENSIRKLSALLTNYHGEKTVILMDEYDTPIIGGYIHDYYPDIIHFMRNLLGGALKDNEYLEKGVLTGILRVAKESIFSGLNNLEVFTLLRNEFSPYFGLLSSEVEAMLTYYGWDVEGHPGINEVKDWYNGYIFGKHIIYNPWSIINLANRRQDGLLPYWVNTSNNELVKQLITQSDSSVKEDLEMLMSGGSIVKAIDDNIAFPEIENSTDSLWNFLLFSGYLQIRNKEVKEGHTIGKLALPNKEVTYLYRQIIQGWFQQTIKAKKHQQLLYALTTGDIETFHLIFAELVQVSSSYFDISASAPENFYHAFVLGLLVSLQDRYEVKSNRESGFGRYDVMLIPYSPTDKGIIIEFKKVNRLKNETLAEATEAALKQIEDKHYANELTLRGVQDIIKIGIAFAGKRVSVKAR